MSRKIPERLPPEYLPRPGASADSDDPAVLESRIRRLVRAAEPTLELYREGQTGWWQVLSYYWQPVAVAAFASTAVLILALGFGNISRNAPPRGEMVLVAAASDGNPAALWSVIGQQADPVLALIALEEDKP